MEISRRTALVSGSAFVLAAGLPTAAYAFPAWEARSGMSAADYQTKFDAMAAQGFRPLIVDGYRITGNAEFAAIWMKKGGADWVARHNLSAAAYQQAFDDFKSQGYRPRWISSYNGPTGETFAAIWDKSPMADWQARHALSQADFQNIFNDLGAQGYRMTCVTVCNTGFGQTSYAGLWEKSPGPAWQAYSDMTPDQYQQKFDALSAQGYRPKMIKGYATIVGSHFAAIWEQSGGGAWEAHHNMTQAQFQQKFDAMSAAGFWLSDVTGYQMGGQAGYAGIWLKA